MKRRYGSDKLLRTGAFMLTALIVAIISIGAFIAVSAYFIYDDHKNSAGAFSVGSIALGSTVEDDWNHSDVPIVRVNSDLKFR